MHPVADGDGVDLMVRVAQQRFVLEVFGRRRASVQRVVEAEHGAA